MCLWLSQFQGYPSTPSPAVVKSCVLTVRLLASKGYPGMGNMSFSTFQKNELTISLQILRKASQTGSHGLFTGLCKIREIQGISSHESFMPHISLFSSGHRRGWLRSLQDMHSNLWPTPARQIWQQTLRAANYWCRSWDRDCREGPTGSRLHQHRRPRHLAEDVRRSKEVECVQEFLLCAA